MKVLVVEDKEEIEESVSLCLKLAWPEVNIISSDDGERGADLVETESPDVVILDLDLGSKSGFEVLKEIRSFSDVPIIVFAAKEAEMDKIRALEIGADNYITTPFSAIDLIARVRAILRRATMSEFRDVYPSAFVSTTATGRLTREMGSQGSLTGETGGIIESLTKRQKVSSGVMFRPRGTSHATGFERP